MACLAYIAATGTVQLQVILGGQTVLNTGAQAIAGGFQRRILFRGGFVHHGDRHIRTDRGAGNRAVRNPGSKWDLLNLPNAAPFTVNTTVSQALTFAWTFGTQTRGIHVR